MNTNTLQALTDRWPNDTVSTSDSESLQILLTDVGGAKNHSAYQNSLHFDTVDSQCIAAFAQANGFTYHQVATYQISADGQTPAWVGPISPTLTPLLAHEVSGTLFGYGVSFMLAYTAADWQKKEEAEVALTKRSIIQVSLPKPFPQLFLDSNKNDKSLVSAVPTSFKADQKLKLEGSFNEYFDFYAPRGLQVNSLTVLAPNFMQLLIDGAAIFDVEFYGNELFLISKDPIYTPANMETALKALEIQLNYLTRLLTSWSYQPLKPPFDRLQSTYFTGAVVKVGPMRLSPAMLIGLILASIALLGLVAFVLNSRYPTASG